MTFDDEARYSKEDFAKWQQAAEKLYNYDSQKSLVLVYKNKTHVATYNTKKETIAADDLSVFGK